MIETNTQNLSTKEIIQKIQQEVNKHWKPALQATPPVYFELTDFMQYSDTEFITNLYRNILKQEPDKKEMQPFLNKLRTGELSKIEILLAVRFSEEGKSKNVKILGIKSNKTSLILHAEKSKSQYIIADFTQYDDVAFITNLYHALLDREPDAAGMQQYLHLLRTGVYSKIEILIALRFSEEGKSKNVKILGIKKRRFIVKLYHMPIIGYISKTVTTLLTLPKLLRRLNHCESCIATNRITIMENEIAIEESVQDTMQLNSMNKTELETLSRDLYANIDIKADKFNIILNDSFEEEPSPLLNTAVTKLNQSFSHLQCYDQSDLYYLLFENVFYDHYIVKEKQKIYIPYIKSLKTKTKLNWLDIGCGRGEFLDILQLNNIKNEGVEINTVEYQTLVENGCKVSNLDAISFLNESQQKFKGISALQVIEHLDYEYLKEMLHLSFKKIEPGGMIILETINPRNELGLANFYMDETHKRPLPAEMMMFLLEWVGFRDIKIVYSALLPDNYRNIEIKNNYHDYAVMGYKI